MAFDPASLGVLAWMARFARKSLVKDRLLCEECNKPNFSAGLTGEFYILNCCGRMLCENCLRRVKGSKRCRYCSEEF